MISVNKLEVEKFENRLTLGGPDLFWNWADAFQGFLLQGIGMQLRQQLQTGEIYLQSFT